MTVENISWSISTKECCRPRRGRTRDLLISSRTAHPTEPPRLAEHNVDQDQMPQNVASDQGLHLRVYTVWQSEKLTCWREVKGNMSQIYQTCPKFPMKMKFSVKGGFNWTLRTPLNSPLRMDTILDEYMWQTVKSLIIHCVLWCLILVYTVFSGLSAPILRVNMVQTEKSRYAQADHGHCCLLTESFSFNKHTSNQC